MDTKMQALEKAQKMQREKIRDGETYVALQHYNESHYFSVEWTSGHKVFKFGHPRPLEKDTLCLCGDGVMRYAMGELSEDGINTFYPQGYCSKNIDMHLDICGFFAFRNFEIIETPDEFERVQTGIEMCLSNRCIYFDPRIAKCMADYPDECTVLVGKPSKLNTAKNCKP